MREDLRRGSTRDRTISKEIEGDRRTVKGIEGDRRTAKGIEGDRRNVDPPRRFSKVVGDPRRSSKGRERSSGCPYGLGRRWRWLSRLYREREMPIEGQRCRLAVWG